MPKRTVNPEEAREWLRVRRSSGERSCLTLGLIFMLVGCASGGAAYGSRRVEADPLPNPRAAASSRSMKALSAAALDRANYVRAVLASNPTIESARQGWRGALARGRQAGALEDPMLDVQIAPLSIGSSRAPLGYEVGISQKLPWLGKRSLEESIGAAEADAAKSDYESAQRELAFSAALLYDQYFVAARALEINARHVELIRALRDSAALQVASGQSSSQEALQAESELAHIEHDTVVLTTQRDVTVAQMNELLHRAPELPLPPPPDALPPPRAFAGGLSQLEAEAVAHRPDIAAARHHERAEQARVDRADRESYPDFTISTSYNSMWDMPEHRWMVGIGLNLPVQTGSRTAAADEARATQARFSSEISRMTDAARTQVFVALKQLDESRRVLDLFERRLIPLENDRVAAARAGFVASHDSFASVIDAEKSLRGVELDYQMTRAEYDRRSAELERALGRVPALDARGLEP